MTQIKRTRKSFLPWHSCVFILTLCATNENFSFAETQYFGIGSTIYQAPSSLELEDLRQLDVDGDGDQDLLYGSKNEFAWIERTGAETSSVRHHLIQEKATRQTLIGDMNGNGIPDVVSNDRDHIAVWLDPSLTENPFTDKKIISQSAVGIALADVDKDGYLDIVAAHEYDVGWYRNLGTNPPQFEFKLIHQQRYQSGLNAGDIDQDGDIDIFAKDQDGLAVFYNNGASNPDFVRQIIDLELIGPVQIDSGQLNSGTGFDLVVVERQNYKIHIYFNGRYKSSLTTENSSYATSVQIVDLDKDGDNDLLVQGDDLFWWENLNAPGEYSFSAARGGIGKPIYGVALAADWDNDGDLDVLGSQNQNFQWFENGQIPLSVDPPDGATLDVYRPILKIADPPNNGLEHAKTHWQIASDPNFEILLLDQETSDEDLMQFLVPDGFLSIPRKYYWRFSYGFSASPWSSPWSLPASYTLVDKPKLTLRVPQDVPTINEALRMAGNGSEITVAPGVYAENVEFQGWDVWLHSSNPDDAAAVSSTIIKAQDGIGVQFQGNETEACRISGFTLREGSEGIRANGAKATIDRNCITKFSKKGINHADGLIEYNTITSSTQGLYLCNGIIRSNRIENNHSYITANGGGLGHCDGIIESNIIVGNSTAIGGGGLYDCDGIIRNNIIARNSATWVIYWIYYSYGYGLAFCDGVIANNTIVLNGWSGSAAIAVSPTGGPIGPVIIPSNGGGLYECRGTIINNIIWGNETQTHKQVFGCSPVQYCLMGEQAEAYARGEGVTEADPEFVDAANDDFRLKPTSPAIDAGARVAEVTADIHGRTRGIRVAPVARGDGSAYDLGAEEYVTVAIRLLGKKRSFVANEMLELEWISDIFVTGTAVRLELLRNEEVVRDWGARWNPEGRQPESLGVPEGLAEGTYVVRATSIWDSSFTGQTEAFFIGTGRSGVAAGEWLLFR